MESTLELFQMEKDEATYWSLRPKLTERQLHLYSCYNRRETKQYERISEKSILKSIECVNYETDLALIIIQTIDDHYLNLCAEKARAKNNG